MTEEDRRLAAAASDDVDALIDALGDPSWRVRKEAAARLAALGAGAVAARLIGLLGDEEVGRSAGASEALAALGAAAAPALLDALPRGGARRRFIIDALGAARDPAAVPALIRALADGDDNVRAAACEALGALAGVAAAAGPEATAALRGALIDASLSVRHAALAGLIAADAVVPLAEVLPLCDEPVLRGAALALLGRTGDAAGVPPLVDGL